MWGEKCWVWSYSWIQIQLKSRIPIQSFIPSFDWSLRRCHFSITVIYIYGACARDHNNTIPRNITTLCVILLYPTRTWSHPGVRRTSNISATIPPSSLTLHQHAWILFTRYSGVRIYCECNWNVMSEVRNKKWRGRSLIWGIPSHVISVTWLWHDELLVLVEYV